MHDVTNPSGGERGIHHADAGLDQESSGARQNTGVHTSSQQLGLLSRKDRGAFNGHTTGQHDLIANRNTRLPHEAIRGHLAEHLADENRAVEALGDLGMAATERDVQFRARDPHVGHDPFG